MKEKYYVVAKTISRWKIDSRIENFLGYMADRKWSKAIELVKELASVVEGATVISWDLAYSDKGWLVVEGNDVGEPYLLQAPLQIGLKDKMISFIDKYFQ